MSVVIIQLLSCVCLFVTSRTAAWQTPLSSSVSWSLLKFMSIESVLLSNQLILCHPLLLPSVIPSIRVFSNELALCIRWPKYWGFSPNVSSLTHHSSFTSVQVYDSLPHSDLGPTPSIQWPLHLFRTLESFTGSSIFSQPVDEKGQTAKYISGDFWAWPRSSVHCFCPDKSVMRSSLPLLELVSGHT